MASISPLSIISTIKISHSSSMYQFSQKQQKSSKHRKLPRRQVITFSGNISNQNNPKEEQELQNIVVGNRRNVLIGLGGLCGTFTTNPFALASPISPPDLSTCGPPDLPLGATPNNINFLRKPNNINCCPPNSTKIIDYKIPSSNQPLRVRQAANLVNDEYLQKYKKAIELTKALPSNDPRSFIQQANIHCAYCDGAYSQVGFPNLDLQVHNSWLFFPFHRWYLYFHERILGSLINDPAFALPFWNFDAPNGMQFPSIENVPHNTIHTWSGDNRQPNHENMGNFYSAARDPVFFSHHSNIDRLWSIWKTLGGKRKDFNDKDWLESEFLFYDENKNLVKVNVKDCLDTQKLGYVYQDVDIPWLNAKPTPCKKIQKKVEVAQGNSFGTGKARLSEINENLTNSRNDVKFPLVLDNTVSTKRSKKEKEEEEEVSAIKGIEFDTNIRVKFDVFINDEIRWLSHLIRVKFDVFINNEEY
ncbi:polyphenol oxidase A1, chloroplastic [Medicago truncatula]|uniref:polyphenol oxidase A1, chloroplastic n=1 Tax=Medicago truncatula TaxID=3880 RepID=UPI001967D6D5|nr:polyphenol oxidase A1, chloroplastic-like [Medicago truncatula]